MLVIGVGNEMRGDDGAGIEVARRLRERARPAGVDVREALGEATELLEAWEAHDAVVLVDAMRSGAAPGTVRRMDASREPLPARLKSASSTHAVALSDAIELARVLGRLPEQIIVHAVEGRRFEAGVGLSDEVRAGVEVVAEAVLREACELMATAPVRGAPVARLSRGWPRARP